MTVAAAEETSSDDQEQRVGQSVEKTKEGCKSAIHLLCCVVLANGKLIAD